jgi:hypothetical protein
MTVPVILPDEVKCGKYGTLFNYRSGLELNWRRTENWCFLWKKIWWDSHVPALHPLMWQSAKTGLIYRPASTRQLETRLHRLTDLGSIPPPLQSFFPPAEAPFAYFPHDVGYGCGGLWTSMFVDGPWRFTPMTRWELDDLCLRDILEAGGTSLPRRTVIYDCVRVGGTVNFCPTKPDEEDMR